MKRLLFLLALAACDSTGPPKGVEGRWELNTVNGQSLPVRIYDAPQGCDVDVRSGYFEFDVDGSYSGGVRYGTMVAGVLTCDSRYSEGGTYTIADEILTLRDWTGYTHTVTISGNVLTHTLESDQYVYHK